MSTVVLDTHVIYWLSAAPDQLSPSASQAIAEADDLAVAAISWWELAWLASHDRLRPAMPIRSWLDGLGARFWTLGITPAIAETAASLPRSFPGDPSDRLIYATAIEHGYTLITRDERMRAHRYPRQVTLW